MIDPAKPIIQTREDLNNVLDLATKAWDRFGLATLLIIFSLGVFTGWIPSPLSELQADSAIHKMDTRDSLREHRKQTRLMVESCIDSKTQLKKDPKECFRILQDPQVEGRE